MTIIDGTVESSNLQCQRFKELCVQVHYPGLHKAVAKSLLVMGTGASLETFPGRKQLAMEHATPTSSTAPESWHVQASIALPA